MNIIDWYTFIYLFIYLFMYFIYLFIIYFIHLFIYYLYKFSTYVGSGLRAFYVHPLAIDVMFVLS